MGITIFRRTNKGATLTPEGEEFLGYARQVLEQTRLMEEKYCGAAPVKHQFCDSGYQGFLETSGLSLAQMQEEYLRLNNLAIAGKPEDLALTTPMCAAAITTPPGPARAAMPPSRRSCLHRRMWTPSIWNLTTSAAAILSR